MATLRICDLQTGIGRIQRETKELQEKWYATKEHWRDQVAREFEETYLQALLPHLKLTLAAAYEFNEVVGQVEQELGDD